MNVIKIIKKKLPNTIKIVGKKPINFSSDGLRFQTRGMLQLSVLLLWNEGCYY